MISVDTNILLYALNADCPENQAAQEFLLDLGDRDDVVICELAGRLVTASSIRNLGLR